MLSDKYRNHFLSEDTIHKLKGATIDVVDEWNPEDITIKNFFVKGDFELGKEYHQQISLISKAIRKHMFILYDNIRLGYVEIIGAEAFPVKIEFFIINDKFRIYESKHQEGSIRC